MAYAAVVSLKQTIQHLLHPSQSNLSFEVDSIYDDVCYLQSFLESLDSFQSSSKEDALEKQIKDAVHQAEDLIESHTSDRFLSQSRDDQTSTSVFSQQLLKVKQEVNSLTNTVKKEYNTVEQQEEKLYSGEDLVSSTTYSYQKKHVVGFVKERDQVKRSLMTGSSTNHIISIVGMTGIGKTTIAEEVYNDPQVQDAFPRRCFVTLGPKCEMGEILLTILSQLGFPIPSHRMMTSNDLGRHLFQSLFSRKYLIVLDDIWSTNVWEKLKEYIRDDSNGSRIMLTTRMVNVAYGASVYERLIYKIPFLNEKESWQLLRDCVFTAEETCDSQLELIGKKIANICEGLPLAILAVGSLLKKTEKTVRAWEKVAEDESSLIAPIFEALHLSYKELPQHLKSCFLYMGVFPQYYEIPTSELVRLWVAEGLFEQEGISSEEMAEDCLKDLISRSLVLVEKQSSRGRTKACRIHFVYRNLCIIEACNEKFFHVINKLLSSFPQGTDIQRRLCIHNNSILSLKEVHTSMKSVSTARSLLCFGPHRHHGLEVYLSPKLLKVLDCLKIRFYVFPDQVLELAQLRYLAITHDGELPKSIFKLLRLEVLIVRRYRRIKWSNDPVYLPMEIWNMHFLKHLECMGYDLPDPSSADSLMLENLLTLSGVSAQSCKQGILARMPNLFKLGVCIESRHDGADETFSFVGDYTHLDRLESFKWIFMHPYSQYKVAFSGLNFCDNLRKVALNGCGFSWDYMTYIGRMPNLEVLKLRGFAFRGPLWVTNEGEFCKLRYLLLEDLDLEEWKVESDEDFPLLKDLIIKHCYRLNEIPSELVYIPTLDLIELDDCNPSLVASVLKLQYVVGKRHLPVRIHSSWEAKNRK